MADREKLPTREIIATSVKEIKSGKSDTGGDWTLYKVEATTAEGIPIEGELKSFDALPTGEAITVTVKKQEHETYGTSFMLSRQKGSTGKRLSDLEHRMDAVEQRVVGI